MIYFFEVKYRSKASSINEYFFEKICQVVFEEFDEEKCMITIGNVTEVCISKRVKVV